MWNISASEVARLKDCQTGSCFGIFEPSVDVFDDDFKNDLCLEEFSFNRAERTLFLVLLLLH